jgi:hypothetical protein
MIADMTCVAQFDTPPLPRYMLAITTSGVGTGTVTSAPVGIDCGLDCAELYDEDTIVTLTATPATGSSFAAWSGDADCVDGQVTMDAARSCAAQFDGPQLPLHTLTVQMTGTGAGTVTSYPGGINCGATCTGQYSELTHVVLTPVPAALSSFAGWGGNPDCLDRAVTMTQDKTCIAQFNQGVPFAPPTDLVASVAAKIGIKLDWTDNADNETEYRVERRESSAGVFTLIASVPDDSSDYTDKKASRGATYVYRVLACNTAGCSAPSNEVTITVPAFRIFGDGTE